MKSIVYAISASIVLTMSAGGAVSGTISSPVVEQPVQTPNVLAGIQPSCRAYIPSIVWWDHGTGDFVRAIQSTTGTTRARAAAVAKRFCRQTRIGNPMAMENLVQDITLLRPL